MPKMQIYGSALSAKSWRIQGRAYYLAMSTNVADAPEAIIADQMDQRRGR
jgi:hypothetical protein